MHIPESAVIETSTKVREEYYRLGLLGQDNRSSAVPITYMVSVN